MSPALRLRLLSWLAAVCCCGILPAGADAPVPPSVLQPKSAAETWNVLRLVTRNVERLLDEERLKEVPEQLLISGPAIHMLPKVVTDSEAVARLERIVERALVSVNASAQAAKQGNPVGARLALTALRKTLDEAAREFDPKAVNADIYLCPMHADFLAADPKTPCGKCGMDLLARRIPYSFVYTKPGEPTVKLTASTEGPITAGQRTRVTLRMTRGGGKPVTTDDLLVMHTEPIHLLVEEPSLGDYHHEHPKPTETPGEYVFSFTPTKTSPYRVWADLVPTDTGVQELPFVDLPSTGAAGAVEKTENRLTATVDGYRFALRFRSGNRGPIKAKQSHPLEIEVTSPDGQPTTTLEPVMNAFAHLVGFYEDYQTVVHIHPAGGEVQDEAAKGGPLLGFTLFPVKAGFLRLYCHVSIGGRFRFAPFSVNVEE